MCWNQYVSLNTFIFSVFVLILIWFNNKYTQYKTPLFNNKFTYFFFFSFMLMQLIEFFIWRNLDDKFLNHILSIIGMFLVIIQPIASLLMLKDESLKYKLITLYSIVAFPFFIYQNYDHKMTTVVSKLGHLNWKWNYLTGYNQLLYLYEVCVGFIYIQFYFVS